MSHYRFSQLSPIVYYDKVLDNFINNIDIVAYNNTYLIDYKIKDYDTPENICYRLYNDSSLSWVILYLNNIIDPFYDWPMNPNELRKYMLNKYGEEHLNDVHHYILNGKIVNKQPKATFITNEQYEIMQNDSKRDILIPTIELMTLFLNNLTTLDD